MSGGLARPGIRFHPDARRSSGAPFPLSTKHRSWRVILPDGRTVDFTPVHGSIESDLARRDFTINALAQNPTTGEIIDCFGGQEDLEATLIRAVGDDPANRFAEDPLRMLRAARFIARFGLTPMPELVAAVIDSGSRLGIVSAERIRDELDKLIVVAKPAAGLWFLVDTGHVAAWGGDPLPLLELAA